MAKSSASDKILKTTEGYEVTLGTLLGEGTTARVYRATIKKEKENLEVVVKMTKPGQNKFIQDEGKILDAAHKHYREHYKKDQPSPYFYGERLGAGDFFIVMEYLKAKPALDILLEKNKLKEEQVLSLSVDLFNFLDFLHVKCKKAYPDFKFDDIRLEEKGSNLRLRILDLGGLSSVENSDNPLCKGDVLVAGADMLTLLTGYTLQLYAGELTDDIERVLKSSDFQKDVSWGTRQFFGKLLCRVPEFRRFDAEKIEIAKEAADKASELLNLWVVEDASSLFDQIISYSNLANQENDPKIRNDNLAKARAGFDIYVRKFGENTPESKKLLEQAEINYKGSYYLETGKVDLLRHGQFESAIQKFREGETYENDPALFRRWRYLALILKQDKNITTVSSLVEKIGKLFEDSEINYKEALEQIHLFPVSTQSVKLLKIEAQVYLSYEIGLENKSERKYDFAIQEFEKIQELLAEIPLESDQKAIKKEKGDPQILIGECNRLKSQSEEQEKYQSLYHELDLKFSSGKFPLDDLKQFVAKGKYAPDLSEKAAQLLSLAIKNDEIEKISLVAETLFWGVPNKTQNLHKLYSACHSLAAIQLSIVIKRENDELNLLRGLAETSKTMPDVARLVRVLLQRMIESDYASENLDFWKGLKDLFSQLPISAGGSSVKKDDDLSSRLVKHCQVIEDRQKAYARDLANRIKLLLYTPQPGKLDREKLWEQIQSFSMADAKALFASGNARYILLDDYLKKSEDITKQETFSSYQIEIQQLRKDFESQKKAFTYAEEKLSNSNGLGQLQERWSEVNSSSESMNNKLFELLDDCLDYVWYYGFDDTQILGIIGGCYEKIKQAGAWSALKTYRNDRLEKENEKLKLADKHFKEGKLPKAREIMNDLSPAILAIKESVDLQINMLQTEDFEKWAEPKNFGSNSTRDSGLLEGLGKYADTGIPIAYYKNYGIDKYLYEIRDVLQNEKRLKLVELMKEISGPESQPEKKQESSPTKPLTERMQRRVYGKWIVVPLVGILMVIFLGVLFARMRQAASTPATETPNISTPSPTQTLLPITPSLTWTPIPPTPLPISTLIVPNLTPIAPIAPIVPTALTPVATDTGSNLPVMALNVWRLPAFAKCLDNPSNYCSVMDAPVSAGVYALYLYNDGTINTKQVTSQPLLKFTVSLDEDNTFTPIPPAFGLGEIQISTGKDASMLYPPYPKAWAWVGNYNLSQPEKIQVKVDALDPKFGIGKKLAENSGQVLLVKLSDTALWAAVPPPDNSLISGYELFTILDATNFDTEVITKDTKTGKQTSNKLVTSTPLPTPSQPSGSLWPNGSFDLSNGTFWIPNVFPAGTYKIFYHSIDHALDPSSIAFRAGANTVITLTSHSPTSDCSSSWCVIGDFTITPSSPIHILIDIKNTTTPTAPSATVDAILIYKQK